MTADFSAKRGEYSVAPEPLTNMSAGPHLCMWCGVEGEARKDSTQRPVRCWFECKSCGARMSWSMILARPKTLDERKIDALESIAKSLASLDGQGETLRAAIGLAMLRPDEPKDAKDAEVCVHCGGIVP